MLWVGLTGGLGTGKSTVASLLRRLGWQVVDADSIAHQVLSRGKIAYNKVVQHFGPKILKPDLSIDRKKLGMLVFSQPEKLQLLELIIHPEVKLLVQKEKESFIKRGDALAFYDVPLLFEKKMYKDFDKIIVVTCDENTQRQRLHQRNNWTDLEIDLRLKSQLPIQDKIKYADYVIENNGDQLHLELEIKQLVNKLLIDIK
jgi:dephospho-CoA kinase